MSFPFFSKFTLIGTPSKSHMLFKKFSVYRFRFSFTYLGFFIPKVNLGGFAPGVYSLKVTRLEHNGTATDAVIQVTLDALSPTVKLSQPQEGESYTIDQDEWIDVDAQVQDDNTISKVEFVADGNVFGVKITAPFNVKWTIPSGAGDSVDLWAVAYDGAGNKTESQHVKVKLTRK